MRSPLLRLQTPAAPRRAVGFFGFVAQRVTSPSGSPSLLRISQCYSNQSFRPTSTTTIAPLRTEVNAAIWCIPRNGKRPVVASIMCKREPKAPSGADCGRTSGGSLATATDRSSRGSPFFGSGPTFERDGLRQTVTKVAVDGVDNQAMFRTAEHRLLFFRFCFRLAQPRSAASVAAVLRSTIWLLCSSDCPLPKR